MNQADDAKSFNAGSIFEQTGSFLDHLPLGSPHISMQDRPAMSETNSLQDLNEMYDRYIQNIDNPNAFKQKEIQASFEKYIQTASTVIKEPSLMADFVTYLNKEEKPTSECPVTKRSEFESESNSNIISEKECKNKANAIVQRYKFNCLDSIREIDQRMLQGELRSEGYAYYIVLNKVWTSDYIKKSDIKALQPCKVLLLRSIVKRKFDEELSLQLANKRRFGHQKPLECAAFQNHRKACRGVQQVPRQAVLQRPQKDVISGLTGVSQARLGRHVPGHFRQKGVGRRVRLRRHLCRKSLCQVS